MLVLTAVLSIGGLTLVLGSLLVVANRFLYVQEDPRIDAVVEMLPGTNCGGCGYVGCRPFAEALVAGKVLPGKCNVSSPRNGPISPNGWASMLAEEKLIARLACAGGSNVRAIMRIYQGVGSCAAAALVAGGGKGCFWGCLGVGDCQVACTFDAIDMNEHRLPVVDEAKCTGCGDCVVVCPKDLFSLELESQRLWVACRSQEAGDEILEDCQVACTACGRCAMDAPKFITMQGNLPVIDYSRGTACRRHRALPHGGDCVAGPASGQRQGAGGTQNHPPWRVAPRANLIGEPVTDQGFAQTEFFNSKESPQ